MAIEDSVRDGGHAEAKKNEDALDLLEREDVELRRLFSRVEEARGETVLRRAAYGDAAKEIVQHLATREAALVEVARRSPMYLSSTVPSSRLTPTRRHAGSS